MSIKTNKTNKINEKRKRENKLKSQLISEKDNFYKSKIRVVKSLYIFDIIISCSQYFFVPTSIESFVPVKFYPKKITTTAQN